MGLAPSSSVDETCEQPSDKHEATIYYFSGRGLADQIRWMLAASEISFTQKIISQRSQLLRMSARQLPFGQLPLLQIDGIEVVQSQAAIRYLARRAGLQGRNDEEVLKCDMIVEAVRDLLGLVTDAPIKRVRANRQKLQQIQQIQQKSLQTTQTSAPPPAPAQPLSTAAATATTTATTSSTVNGSSTAPAPTTPRSAATLNPVPAPVQRSSDVWEDHLSLMKEKWEFYGARFEAIIRANNRTTTTSNTPSHTSSTIADPSNGAHNAPAVSTASKGEVTGAVSAGAGLTYDPNGQYFLVGDNLTYADILVAHITTWFVEECGHEIVGKMPFLVHLQNQVISLPGVKQFIKSVHYFPLGDEAYVEQVSKVLGRNLLLN